MKVLAVNQSGREGLSDAIVQLTRRELESLFDLKRRTVDGLYAGCEIDISTPYRHAMSILAEVADAKAMPGTLRTLASMLEMQLPQIESLVVEKPPEPPAEKS